MTERRRLRPGHVEILPPRHVSDATREQWRRAAVAEAAQERGEWMLRVIPDDMTITELAQAIFEFRSGDPESQRGLEIAQTAEFRGMNEPGEMAPKAAIPPER